MRQLGRFFLLYILLVFAQMVITNYFHLSLFVTLSILPALVLCIPTRIPTWQALLIAFVTGVVMDLCAEGVAGLNTAALLPVAYARRLIVRLICGEDLIVRGDDFSIRRNGWGKVLFCLLVAHALFLLCFIAVDGAGMRPFWFNLLRFSLSLLLGTGASLFVVDLLSPEERR